MQHGLAIGVSLVTEPPPGVDREFDSVWRAVVRPFSPSGEESSPHVR